MKNYSERSASISKSTEIDAIETHTDMMGSWIEILVLEDNLGMINQKDSLSTNLESNDGR